MLFPKEVVFDSQFFSLTCVIVCIMYMLTELYTILTTPLILESESVRFKPSMNRQMLNSDETICSVFFLKQKNKTNNYDEGFLLYYICTILQNT